MTFGDRSIRKGLVVPASVANSLSLMQGEYVNSTTIPAVDVYIALLSWVSNEEPTRAVTSEDIA